MDDKYKIIDELLFDLVSKINNKIYPKIDNYLYMDEDESGVMLKKEKGSTISFVTKDKEIKNKLLNNLNKEIPFKNDFAVKVLDSIIKIYKEKKYVDKVPNIKIPKKWKEAVKTTKENVYYLDCRQKKLLDFTNLKNEKKKRELFIRLGVIVLDKKIKPVIVLRLPSNIFIGNLYITLDGSSKIYNNKLEKCIEEQELYKEINDWIEAYFKKQLKNVLGSDFDKESYEKLNEEDREHIREIARMYAI